MTFAIATVPFQLLLIILQMLILPPLLLLPQQNCDNSNYFWYYSNTTPTTTKIYFYLHQNKPIQHTWAQGRQGQSAWLDWGQCEGTSWCRRKGPEGIIDPSQLSPPRSHTHTPWAVTCEITAPLVRFVSEGLYQLLNVPWRQVRREIQRNACRSRQALITCTQRKKNPTRTNIFLYSYNTAK